MKRGIATVEPENGERQPAVWHEFDSFPEFVQYITDCDRSKLEWSNGYGNGDWSGTDTLEEAISLARQGWTIGSATLDALRADVVNTVMRSVPIPVATFCEDSGSIDMGRYLGSEPECMVDWQQAEVPNPKVISIFANIGTRGSFTARDYLQRGAAIVALVDGLETAGRRVELTVCAAAVGGQKIEQSAFVIRLKEANEPLNMATLAYTLMHVSMHRRLVFAARESDPDFASIGASIDMQIDGYDIVLSTALQPGANQQDISRWVLKRMREAGVTVDQ